MSPPERFTQYQELVINKISRVESYEAAKNSGRISNL